jgi:sec-independent protein translocase protein TatA
MPIGPLELGIVLLVVLLIFGPKRLPGLGKQLGSGMREFKDGITGDKNDEKDDRPEEIAPAAQASSTQSSAETEDVKSRS